MLRSGPAAGGGARSPAAAPPSGHGERQYTHVTAAAPLDLTHFAKQSL